jgi:hypothetical protein
VRPAVIYGQKIEAEEIYFDMRLPSGEAGLRGTGHPVLVRMTPDLAVEIISPSSERVILSGVWNLCSVVWDKAPEELCPTALDMIDATVEQITKLFSRGYLDGKWLTPRARYEVGTF